MYRERDRRQSTGARGDVDFLALLRGGSGLGLRFLWLALLGALLLVATGVWDASAALAAASPLTWSEPEVVEAGAVITSVSCPSASLCVAVDNKGQVFSSTEPAAGAGTWNSADVTEEKSGFASVSCPSASLCVAIDGAGNVWSTTDPTGAASGWSSANITEGAGFGGQAKVSCASASLCVIAPAGERQISFELYAFVYVSSNPTGGKAAWPERVGIDGAFHGLDAVSCLSAPMCVAAGGRGDVVTSDNPLGTSGEWSPANVDEENGIFSVSCPSTGFCAAGDIAGNVVTSTNPTGGSVAWSMTHVDGGNAIFGVSCPSASLCAAVDDQGNIIASVKPTGGETEWNVTKVEEGGGLLDAISCPSAALCVAADVGGNLLVGTSESGGGEEEGGGKEEGGGGPGGGAGFDAQLTLGQQAPAGPLRLDGSGTTAGGERIAGYRFKLSSAPGEIACAAQAPDLNVNFAGPTVGTATLTVIGAGGSTSIASIAYTNSGPKLIPRGRRGGHKSAIKYRASQPVVSAQCQPGPHSQPTEVTVGGKSINSTCEVHAGLVDAVGCGLHQVNLCSGLPGAERQILEAHLNGYSGCHANLEARGAFISRARDSSGTHIEKCAFHCVPVVDTYYASSQPVRVNGLDIVPGSGASVVIAVGGLYSTNFSTRHAAYLVSSKADVKLPAELSSLPLRLDSSLDYSVGSGEAKEHLADFDVRHPLPFLPEFDDLPLTGTLSADLVPGGATELAANVGLPGVFTDEEGNGLTTSLALRTDNVNGLYVNSFHLSIPYALLGDTAIEEASLDYSRATDALEGKASVLLPSGDTVSAELGFLRGTFNKFSFDYMFGPGEGIEIFDGIFLTELFGGLRLNPAELEGGSRVSIGPSVTDQGCGSVDVRGNLTIHFGPLPFSIGGTGTNELLCQDVGARYFHIDSDGHVEIGENVRFVIPSPETGEEPPLGKVSGEMNGLGYADLKSRKFHFQFDGVEQASLNLFELSGEYTAEAVVSDLGFGVCAEIEGPLGSKWHPGFGEDFAKVDPGVLIAPPPIALALLAKNLTVEADSCNIAQYRTIGSASTAGASAANARASASAFRIPAGQRTTILMLHGEGGSPRVILRGPKGRVVDATQSAPAIAADRLVLHVPSEDITEIQLRGKTAGKWAIEAAAGSPAITKVALSHELPPPVVKARVSGRGAHRVLRYETRLPAGTRVTFLEHGTHGSTVIGSTSGRRGHIAFVPSAARAGRRVITAALVSPAGTPKPSVKVTTYRAEPPQPGQPGPVHIHRARSGLRISFAPAPLAPTHFVTVDLSDGRHLFFILRGGRHSVLLPRVSRKVRIRSVRVRGEGLGRLGPAARGPGRHGHHKSAGGHGGGAGHGGRRRGRGRAGRRGGGHGRH
jgi:hypothetical protein